MAILSSGELMHASGTDSLESTGAHRQHARVIVWAFKAVTCVSYSPISDRAATASNDKTVRIWNLR